jgi:hypothetical protein
MTISRISSATNNGTGVTLPTHAENDVIIIGGYRDASATAPTLPAGWYGLYASPTSAPSMVIGWKRATSSTEQSGTWTNANTLHATVYRPAANKLIIPVFLNMTVLSSSATVTFGAQTAGTFPTNIDDYWIFGFMGQRNSGNALETKTFTGLTNVSSSTDGAGWQVIVNDSNATQTTAWTSQSASVTTAAAVRSVVLGLWEVPQQSASGGGGIFFRPGMAGGMSE